LLSSLLTAVELSNVKPQSIRNFRNNRAWKTASMLPGQAPQSSWRMPFAKVYHARLLLNCPNRLTTRQQYTAKSRNNALKEARLTIATFLSSLLSLSAV